MAELFADLPEAIANTSVIAQRCAVAAPQRRPILPRLGEDEDEQLRSDARAGLAERLSGRSAVEQQQYFERLEYELDVIMFTTGFDAITNTMLAIDIHKRGDVSLREK